MNWQPLSEQAISDALASNKRLFIDVTADWCVTCKANKYNVLLRDDVQSALWNQTWWPCAETGVARRPLSAAFLTTRGSSPSLQSNLRTGINAGPRAVSAAQPRRTPSPLCPLQKVNNHENHRCTLLLCVATFSLAARQNSRRHPPTTSWQSCCLTILTARDWAPKRRA